MFLPELTSSVPRYGYQVISLPFPLINLRVEIHLIFWYAERDTVALCLVVLLLQLSDFLPLDDIGKCGPIGLSNDLVLLFKLLLVMFGIQ